MRTRHAAFRVEGALGASIRAQMPVPANEFMVSMAAVHLEPPGAGPLVLVIEDEAAIRTLARRILERAGYRALLAEDGLAGVEMLSEHRGQVAVVLLDLSMPRMGGVEAYHTIRKLRPDVPVVLWSAHSWTYAVRLFSDGDLAGFVQKPFGMSELLDVVQRALESLNPAALRDE